MKNIFRIKIELIDEDESNVNYFAECTETAHEAFILILLYLHNQMNVEEGMEKMNLNTLLSSIESESETEMVIDINKALPDEEPNAKMVLSVVDKIASF